MQTTTGGAHERALTIEAGEVRLHGDLHLVEGSQSLVVFVHGSGSSRLSPRNRQVAGALQQAGLGTLLFDLLSPEEEEAERYTRHLRFDIELLTRRVAAATDWLGQQGLTSGLRVGYFGASTGAAAALQAAAAEPGRVGAVVSRGGRPDLAGAALRQVVTPTLLIVGGRDTQVLELNREAYRWLAGPKELAVVPGASHLFEEGDTLEQAAELAARWFRRYL